MTTKERLSMQSVTILSLIAEGYSYSQIVDGHPNISYLDVFGAAEEALKLNESPIDYCKRMERIKKKYPNAYQKWTVENDASLAALHGEGVGVTDMAKHFKRQPSAIRSRLSKLRLIPPKAGMHCSS